MTEKHLEIAQFRELIEIFDQTGIGQALGILATLAKQRLDQLTNEQAQLGRAAIDDANDVDTFIEAHRSELEFDDIEFLAEEFRSTNDVAAYLVINRSTVARRAKSHGWESRRIRRANHYRSLDVVRTQLGERGVP